jgi:hypothetical protein
MKLHTPVLAVFGLFVFVWFLSGPLSYITGPDTAVLSNNAAVVATSVTITIPQKGVTQQSVLTQSRLLELADSLYQDGTVPLGDYRYSTTVAKKGYVYLCNARKDNPGAAVNGPWIKGDTWNFKFKTAVSGSVSWPNAKFTNTVTGSTRTLAGNALPLTHTTGIFPVASTDGAALYDRNPNSISAQTISLKLPSDPVYSATPYCMGGEVGIMLSGVPLFNAFDAGLRDAPAHELQDSCDGHPQGSGEYHYHSLSKCFKDTEVQTVLGYAYDGFPITGSKVADGKFLTTDDLDECHGITSDVIVDGKKKTTYHYVMTIDFPYSAGCFRAKPVTTGPSAGAPQSGGQQSGRAPQSGTANQPPPEAQSACSGKSANSSCSFTTTRGDAISGVCDSPPGSPSLACIPR